MRQRVALSTSTMKPELLSLYRSCKIEVTSTSIKAERVDIKMPSIGNVRHIQIEPRYQQ